MSAGPKGWGRLALQSGGSIPKITTARERSVRTRGEEGLTLIEVLAAMLVLAVGMIGVQALGIGAARLLARADQQTGMAVAATAAMEVRQQEIRRDPAGVVAEEECALDATAGVDLCVRVDPGGSSPDVSMGSARITVRAVHPRLPRDTFSITSWVYDPAIP